MVKYSILRFKFAEANKPVHRLAVGFIDSKMFRLFVSHPKLYIFDNNSYYIFQIDQIGIKRTLCINHIIWH